MIDRNTLIQEAMLRKHISKLIRKNKELYQEEKLDSLHLSNYVKQLISEVKVEDEVPNELTGINILEDLLKKIIPTIETDYKMLTTDKAQRDSYRAHMVTAIQNALIPSDVRKNAETDEESPEVGVESEAVISEVDVNVGGQVAPGEPDIDLDNAEDAFIDIKNPKKQKKTAFMDLPHQDVTGRNIALKTFEKIEKNIIDSYATLDNEEDETIFYDYLLVNIKLYLDKFEDELQAVVSEPTNATYEKEKKPGEKTADAAKSEVEEPLVQ